MAHKRPSRNKLFIKLYSPHEVESTLLVVASETVVVPNYTAGFRPILIILENIERQISQLSVVFLYIQDVRIKVKVFIPVRISSQ